MITTVETQDYWPIFNNLSAKGVATPMTLTDGAGGHEKDWNKNAILPQKTGCLN